MEPSLHMDKLEQVNNLYQRRFLSLFTNLEITGKTHTMEGKLDPPELRGIIPRTFEHVYRVIEGSPSK